MPSAARGRPPAARAAPRRRCSRCPRPMRNTPRMIENVYVVPPSSSDSSRVHTTSAPSAVSPLRRDDHVHGRGPPHEQRAPPPSPTRRASASCVVRAASAKREQGHGGVERGRHVSGGRPCRARAAGKSRRAAAQHGAGHVPAVEEPQPRHALGRGLDPPRDGRQRRAHQHRRRQQQIAHKQRRAVTTPSTPWPAIAVYTAAGVRHPEQHGDADDADAQLEQPRRRAADAAAPRRTRGSARLPRHMPPMNVPSSTPRTRPWSR